MPESRPILTTERLILRNLCAKDLDELFDYRNDPRSNQYQRGQFRDRDALEKLIARRANDVLDGIHSGQFAVALREDDSLIGEISMPVNADVITLGYTLSYKHHRKGYATEILSALLARLRELNPHCTFIAQIESENRASLALIHKLGFHEIARDKQENCITFQK